MPKNKRILNVNILLKYRDVLNLAGGAHRNEEDQRANHIKSISKTPCLQTNISQNTVNRELYFIAKKLIDECYRARQSSEQIVREFLENIKVLRTIHDK